MSQTFPTSLNNYATGSNSITLLAAQHAEEHNALEAKLGIDGSAVTTSIDYLLKNTASIDPGHLHTTASISGALTVSKGGTGLATLTSGSVLVGNGTSAVTLVATTGSGNVVLATSPTLVTPTLGVASATSINKITITAPATGSTITIADGKTLTANNSITIGGVDSKTLTVNNSITIAGTDGKTITVSNSLTLAGTDGTTMTFPSSSDTVAGLGTAQTFTATQTQKQIIFTNNAITASGNAATVPITSRLNTVTNNSAATLTITMATASAVDGQLSFVRILDSSAVAQTISWVNTENSSVSVPTTSNGSTTLPLAVGFQFNGGTSKWRCIATA